MPQYLQNPIVIHKLALHLVSSQHFPKHFRRFGGAGVTTILRLHLYCCAGPRYNTWQATFNPGRNYSEKAHGRSSFDVPDGNQPKTTWEYVVESEQANAQTMQDAAFKGLSNGKDTLTRDDLKRLFSESRVESILKTADKNNDGKIDFDEFVDLLRRG